jgi:hypothetical protein
MALEKLYKRVQPKKKSLKKNKSRKTKISKRRRGRKTSKKGGGGPRAGQLGRPGNEAGPAKENDNNINYEEQSRIILEKGILNKDLLAEIEIKNKKFKDYLINKYHTFYTYETKNLNALENLNASNNIYAINLHKDRKNITTETLLFNIFKPLPVLAKEIVDKLIEDVKTIKNKNSDKNKYIIFAPGDSPSKIAAYILLIPEHVKKLLGSKIEIISFPLSKAADWDQTEYVKYIAEKIEPFRQYKNVHFGILDAIARGSTINMINNALKELRYKNFIMEPTDSQKNDIKQGEILEDFQPLLGYNLLFMGSVYEYAEDSHNNMPKCRCMPNYEMKHYKKNEIDNKDDYRKQLYNCNIYLYYWYAMRDIMKQKKWNI